MSSIIESIYDRIFFAMKNDYYVRITYESYFRAHKGEKFT